MAKEPAAYRNVLEDLLAFFDGKRLLTVVDVARYTGRTREWCKARYAIDPKAGISTAVLAYKLSNGGS